MWAINSPIGLIRIYLDKSSGQYCLEFSGDVFSCYNDPSGAADDIAGFVTGYVPYDSLCGSFDPPTELSEWSSFR